MLCILDCITCTLVLVLFDLVLASSSWLQEECKDFQQRIKDGLLEKLTVVSNSIHVHVPL